jgi:hypothetical protein
MAWYLSETFADVTDVATFEEKKRTVSMVVRRMIKHDNTILVVDRRGETGGGTSSAEEGEGEGEGAGEESGGKEKSEDKWLRLNPNHDL